MKRTLIEKFFCFFAILFLFPGSLAQTADGTRDPYAFLNEKSGLFPLQESLKDHVQFWIDVFTRHSVSTMVFHNYDDPRIVYRVVDIEKVLGKKDISRKENARFQKNIRNEIKQQLRNIKKYRKDLKKLSIDELEIYNKFKQYDALHLLAKAPNKIRMQNGMREKFLNSLIRSGQYVDTIVDILRKEEVPVEYAVLPHIESEYNYRSYSKYGAAGIWQFTRSTGRNYMTINQVIDERRDPVNSTHAVARLFKHNYRLLQNWKLVVISHNHGVNGMRRAKNQLRTEDPAVIIQKYRSRLFQFASKNFYPEFLAALEICRNWKDYFGTVSFDPPAEFVPYILPQYAAAGPLLESFNVTQKEFADLNPAIRPAVYRNEFYIPKNFTVKLPAAVDNPETAFASIPDKYKPSRQKLLKRYKVRYGEYLSGIARKLRVSLSNLMRENNIKNPHKIYAGMTLKVPQPSQVYIPRNNDDDNDSRAGKGDSSMRSFSLSESLKIIVLEDEMLDLYAQWADISTSVIKKYNNIRRKDHIAIGQPLYIPIPKDRHEEFHQKRKNFQAAIENDFFAKYEIKEIIKYKIKPNENLWTICYIKYEIPVWLLIRHNARLQNRPLYKGEIITIPIISLKNGEQN